MSTPKHSDILSRMTLEEKVSLLSGRDFWQTKEIPRLDIPSIYLADGPHGIRRQAVDAQQIGLNIGIPATCFPTEATVANSWNVELGEKVGSFLGNEAVAQRVNVLLGPGINMKRNPLGGRNFEYFSEDPYLAGKMAAAYIRGIQSQGIAACVKHFAASNQEWRVMTIDAVIDERTLREIYLTAFEIAVTEGRVKSLMSAYNRVNGTYVNEHPYFMNKVLRGEWNYQGCVITNWGGSNDRVEGLKAGNELEMPGSEGETDRQILQALEQGIITEDLIDENVDRLLDLVLSTSAVLQYPKIDFNIPQHHRVSQRVAEESIVLLKNHGGILPLSHTTKVAVIGDFARNARYQGAGSSLVNPTVLDNTMDCFDESGISSIGFERGFERYGKESSRLIDRACALARKADTVLLYLGLDEDSESQGVDRSTMRLPDNQIQLLEALSRVNPNIVVILSCGCAVEMPWIDTVRGLLHAYLGGQAGARAILRVISGDVNPSGKLAESLPRRYEDTPAYRYYPGKDLTVEYREGPYIGYRYYDTAGVEPLFPFGFGLSYTRFGYSDISVDREGVEFFLENQGPVAGMEVAQLYVGKSESRIYRPLKELKGFVKVLINPGQRKRIRIPFDDKTFRFFNPRAGEWQIEGGSYEIMVGSSSRDIHLTASLEVEGTAGPLPGVWSPESLPSYYTGGVGDVSEQEFSRLLGRPVPQGYRDRSKPLGYNDALAETRYAQGWAARLFFWSMEALLGMLHRTGRRKQANLIMMSVYHLPFRGIARLTGGRVSMEMVDGLLLISNGRFLAGAGKVVAGWYRKRRRKPRRP